MTHSTPALVGIRDAIEEFARSAEACGGTWTVPRGPRKWTPAQIVEHVARAVEESANDMAGRKTRLLSLPGPARVLVRSLVFNRVAKHRKFFKAKTNRAMDPETGPGAAKDARARLHEALTAFEIAADASAREGDTIHSVVFGRVSLADYIVFQELHVRHHRTQLPEAAVG
jgi:hypothetical protein